MSSARVWTFQHYTIVLLAVVTLAAAVLYQHSIGEMQMFACQSHRMLTACAQHLPHIIEQGGK